MNRSAAFAFVASLALFQSVHAQAPSCTTHNTKLIKDGDEYCFTVRPLPQCRPSCTATSTTQKNVAVHCIAKGAAAHHFETRINDGARDVDFSRKPVTKNLSVTIPVSCS